MRKATLGMAIGILAALAVQPLLTSVQASPAIVMQVTQDKIPLRGKANAISGSFSVQNSTASPLTVQVENIRVPEYAFTFSTENRILQPDESTQVRFSGAIHQDGTFIIFPTIQLLDARRNVVFQEATDITFEVRQGSFRKIALADLTARRARGTRATLPKLQRLDPSLPLPVGFNTPEPSVAQLESFPRTMMDRIPSTVGGSTTDAEPDQQPPTRRSTSRSQFPWAAPQQSNQPRSGTMLLKGALRYKSITTSWNPAYGWVAKVTVLDKNQKYVTLGRTELDWSGKWSFTVPGQWAGYAVQVTYEMANRFFLLRDPDDLVTYFSPFGNVAKMEPGATQDIGLGGLDLSKANTAGFAGLGDIYNEGMRLWLAMVNVGISPLAASAIKVTFPNTKHVCPDGKGGGQVGTCTDIPKRESWLVYSDVTRRGTMQHELAHQIQGAFWPANPPPGGPHVLKECSDELLALAEGFADFLPVWVQASRDKVPYGDFGFSIESPNGNCDTNNKAELWVAGTFWDMYDTVQDGKDNVYWSSKGTVISVFLGSYGFKNGQKIKRMSDFQSIYADLAEKSGAQYKTAFQNIFIQNHTGA